MNIVIRILLFCLGVFFTIGIAVSVSNVPATGTNTAYTGVFQYCDETIQVSPSQNYSNVTVLLSLKNTGDKTYSMDPQNWIVGIKGKPYHSSIASETYFSDVNNGWDITPGNEGSMSMTYVVDGFVDVGSPVDLTYIGKNCTPPKTLPCTIQSLSDNYSTTTTNEEEPQVETFADTDNTVNSLEELNKPSNWLDLLSKYNSMSQKESSDTLSALKSNNMDALLISAQNRQYNAEWALNEDKKIDVPAVYQTANIEWVEQLKDESMSAIYLQQFAKNSKKGIVDESTYSWYEYYTKNAMTHMDSVTALL